MIRALTTASLLFAFACGNVGGGADAATESGAPDASADVDASQRSCTGPGSVCGSGFSCAEQFTTNDCYGKTCCILAPTGDPPYYDDAGSCPGFCASPDDIGCPHWYRGCANGTLCCVLSTDAGTD